MSNTNTKPYPVRNTSEITDELGMVLAEKAALAKREADLKARLIDAGTGAYEGDFYRATVSITEGTTVNWKKIAEKLEPSRQLVQAHSKPTTSTRVAVKSMLASSKGKAA
jgi:hypothetical protein